MILHVYFSSVAVVIYLFFVLCILFILFRLFVLFFFYYLFFFFFFFFFSSRRRHTRLVSDWSSDVCSSDLGNGDGSPGASPPRTSVAPETGRAARRGEPIRFRREKTSQEPS